ncbi:DUF1580 domain-containing protein [Botrimarina mediterranea]|uniref:Uncharacterized protein n=1 Tax=Botrimarina mediterranea TaxID=2528022 RepID=A0A518K935_9BACT|nr:DUF1580 domain-containing protein [Botrimarina mediterranea]QDV74290.1 hypothetical protein Spa11_24910 [Botrimarina mediterranea]
MRSESTEKPSPDDEHLSLAEAAKTLPGRPHLSTLHRWRLRGIRGVRLKTCLVGGRRYTTPRWLREFIAASTAAGDGLIDPPSNLSRDREQSIRSAIAELDAAGI